MPRKKTYRKRRPKKRTLVRNWNTPSSSVTLFGRSKKAKMAFYERFRIDAALAGTATHVFSANSVYQPDYTGGLSGHQPRGFDQLMTMFDHAVVIGCRITVDFAIDQQDNEVDTPILCGISVRDSVATSSYNNYMENRIVSYTTLNTNGAHNVKRLTLDMNPNLFLGRSKPLSDPNLKNSSGSSPAEQCYFHVWCFAPDGKDPKGVVCSTRMEFNTVFIEPKTPVIS